MNIRDLKYLVAVADTLHFGQAADHCFVSQPTLSMQIKKLEDELGVAIFERTNKQVLVTPIGERLIAQARQILFEVDKLKSIAEQAKCPLSGDFRLGIIPTLGPYLLPIMLPAIHKKLPNLNLIITENKTEHLVEQLLQGDIDVTILALPINEPSLKQTVLFEEPFYLALHASHPLCAKDKISLNDLRDADLLLLEEGHCLRDQALEACQFVGAKQQHGTQATSLETLRHMVAANLGITLLPELAIKYTFANKNIKTKAFKKPSPKRDIAMLWRETSALEECCTTIADVIKAVVKL